MKREFVIILIVGLLSGLLIFGLGKKEIKINEKPKAEDVSYYKVSTYLTEEIINNTQTKGSVICLSNEYTPKYMLEIADNVIIGSVISVDSADTKYSQSLGYTYGKLVVNNVLYGNLKQGDVIDYMKPGGIMTIEESEKYDLPEQKEKKEYLRKQAGIDISKNYINTNSEYNPLIEEGKTYLIYLKYSEIGKYEVIGLENGLRELNIEKRNVVSSKTIEIDNYKILNNITQEYESLTDYINAYIK